MTKNKWLQNRFRLNMDFSTCLIYLKTKNYFRFNQQDIILNLIQIDGNFYNESSESSKIDFFIYSLFLFLIKYLIYWNLQIEFSLKKQRKPINIQDNTENIYSSPIFANKHVAGNRRLRDVKISFFHSFIAANICI